LVKKLESNEIDRSDNWVTIDEIKRYIAGGKNHKIVGIGRESNQVADLLAKKATVLGLKVWRELFQHEMFSYVLL
jgi:hypothetical protein